MRTKLAALLLAAGLRHGATPQAAKALEYWPPKFPGKREHENG